MKNLTGITLNGEWLGNNVLINGMFRAICTISPVVMQEFIHIVNGIDQLEDAVSIQNFNCKDKNSIDIEFANKDLSGLASLYFTMNNGNPELINSFLKLDKKEDIATKNAIEVIEESIKSKPAKSKKKKSKKKAQTETDYSNDYAVENDYLEEEYYDNGYYNEEQDVVDYYDAPAYNNYEAPAEYQAGSYDGYAEEDYAEVDYRNSMPVQEYRTDERKDEYYEENSGRNYSSVEEAEQRANNNYSDSDINETENTVTSEAEEDTIEGIEKSDEKSTKPLSKKEFNTESKENNEEDDENENENEEDDDDDKAVEGRRSERTIRQSGNALAQRQRGMRPQGTGRGVAPTPMRGGAQGRAQGHVQGRVSANSDLQQIVITANSINITPSDFEQNGRKNRDRNEEVLDEERTKRGHNKDNETKDAETSKEKEVEAKKEEENKNDNHIIIPEIINENYNPEDISEFLADFYTSDKIEAEITREQALLKEIQSLKEEINELHGQQRGSEEEEEETPMTLEEFYARQIKKAESKANTYGYTFRIVGTNKRIRANVVDPELFIAGDKLYRWGEKLYLEN